MGMNIGRVQAQLAPCNACSGFLAQIAPTGESIAVCPFFSHENIWLQGLCVKTSASFLYMYKCRVTLVLAGSVLWTNDAVLLCETTD